MKLEVREDVGLQAAQLLGLYVYIKGLFALSVEEKIHVPNHRR